MNQFYAITPNNGTYPEYINLASVNPSHSNDPNWKILVTVRSAKKSDGTVGETATIELARGEAAEIAKAILTELGVSFSIADSLSLPFPEAYRANP